MEMQPGIVSTPRYKGLTLDPSGRRHLVVTDAPGLPEGAFTARPADAEIWVVRSDDPDAFPAPPALLAALAARLALETVGLRLYAAGTEGFIWDAAEAGYAAGMIAEEIFLCRTTRRRRVYCTHCTTSTDDVTTSVVVCSGCGVSILVRDHFSRRMRAYMAVQVDAEVPGEIPDPEELYA